MATSTNPWDIESLVRAAFVRVKTRFLSYFLAYILMYISIFGVTVLVGFIGTLAVGSFAAAPNIASGVLLALLIVFGLLAIIYVVAYSQLVLIHILIQEPQKSLMKTIQSIKGDVWGYVWALTASFIFYIGLVPFGVPSVMVVFLLWAVLGSFFPFVYITQKKKGLDNVWVSYSMVKQNFWGVAGRIIVVVAGFIMVSILLKSINNDLVRLLEFVLSLLSGPFMMSYLYEIYKNMTVPTEVKRSNIWIGMSVVGYVLIFLIVIAIASDVRQAGDRLMNWYQNTYNEEIKKYQVPDDTLDDMNRDQYPLDIQEGLPEYQNIPEGGV